MDNLLLNTVKSGLAELKSKHALQKNRFEKISGYATFLLNQGVKKNGTVYYCVRKKGTNKYKYCGNEKNNSVKLIKEARYLAKSLEIIESDILLAENFLAKYIAPDFDQINSRLPKSYRITEITGLANQSEKAKGWKNKAEAYKAAFEVPYPEELIHKTIDGMLVRSKSEALIYNYLYEHGYTFVYELPIKTSGRTFYPDFTILSEIDFYTVVRIEHQGKMSDPTYRSNAESREFRYWKSGFLPSRDVYFTYDDNKGGFDIGPIKEILKSRVRPE